MKMYKKDGAMANCHKDQKEIMLKAGWSRKPFPVAEKEDIGKEAGGEGTGEEIMEDDEVDTSSDESVKPYFKKKKRKK